MSVRVAWHHRAAAVYGSAMSVLRAPRRQEVRVAATLYGTVSSSRGGSRATQSKARCWLLVGPAPGQYADDESVGGPEPVSLPLPDLPSAGRLIIRAFAPGSRTAVELHDMGLVDEAEVVKARGRNAHTRWNIMLVTGEQITAIAAPCVCGAGRVGNAGPTDERHTVLHVRPETLPWLTML